MTKYTHQCYAISTAQPPLKQGFPIARLSPCPVYGSKMGCTHGPAGHGFLVFHDASESCSVSSLPPPPTPQLLESGPHLEDARLQAGGHEAVSDAPVPRHGVTGCTREKEAERGL